MKDLRSLQEFILEKTGIDVAQYKDDFLLRQIRKRAQNFGMSDTEYCGRIRSDEKEVEKIVNFLTVHHTFFFRDLNKYRALQDLVIPELEKRKKDSKDIKIWSAGCASGEEPYSIGIVFHDYLKQKIEQWRIHILATDMNESMLSLARAGKYAVRHLDKTAGDRPPIDEHFILEDGYFTVSEKVRKPVEFRRHNLISDQYPQGMDIIFCRNVLIYLKNEHGSNVLLKFHKALNDGGYLFLGNFESLDSSFLTRFERVKYAREFIYRKIAQDSDLYKQMEDKQKKIRAGLKM